MRPNIYKQGAHVTITKRGGKTVALVVPRQRPDAAQLLAFRLAALAAKGTENISVQATSE